MLCVYVFLRWAWIFCLHGRPIPDIIDYNDLQGNLITSV